LANDGGFVAHSNGQLRTERDGDTERGYQKPAVQQKTTDNEARYPSCHHCQNFKPISF